MPTLSLCMIVKNEELFLEQCLNSVKHLVNEIVIVDTGSADKTKEIAAKFTDKIFDFKWCDNFSTARNESLKHATKDWILVMDADEIISEKDGELIRKSIEERKISGYFLAQRNYTNNSSVFDFVYDSSDPFSKGYLGWFDSWIIRLFKNDPNIRFEGEVHERVDASFERFSGQTMMVPAVIHHYAESRGLNLQNQKKMLYKKLGEVKIKSDPESAAAHYQLGVIHKEEGDFLSAEKEFKKALELEPHLVSPRLDLALVQQKQGHFSEAIDNYFLLLAKKSNSPEAHFGLGFCYFQEKNLAQSTLHFEKAVQLNPSFLDAYINLGGVYEKQGCYDKAQEALSQALKLSPRSARTYHNLGVLHEKQLHLELALRCYRRALELGYLKEGLKERVEKIEKLLESQP